MIPLLHLATLFSAIFCLFAILRLRSSCKKTGNQNIGDFLKAYISLGLYFVLVSLPPFLAVSASEVQAIYIAANIPVFLSAAFLFRTALRLLGYSRLSNPVFFSIYGLIGLVTFLNIIFFEPASRIILGNFYHWGTGEKTPVWLVSFAGLSLMILALGCALLFFWGGIKSRESFVRIRAFLVGGGLFLLVLAAFFNWIIPYFFQGALRWITGLAASVISLFGLVLMMVGVYYKKEKY